MSGDGKNIIVQADHPTLSWQQLLAHEELHRRIKGDDAYRRSVQDALPADEKLKPYLSRILDRYTEAYRAVKPGITDAEIVEELLADYRAGFDMLDPLGLQDRNTAKVAKAAAKDIRAVEKKGTESKVGVNLDAKSESANPDMRKTSSQNGQTPKKSYSTPVPTALWTSQRRPETTKTLPKNCTLATSVKHLGRESRRIRAFLSVERILHFELTMFGR